MTRATPDNEDLVNDEGAAEHYRRRGEALEADRAVEAARSRRISNARLAVFLALLVCLLVPTFGDVASPAPWLAGMAVFAVVFLLLLRRHEGVIRRETLLADLVTTTRHGLARLERRWDDLPLPAPPPELAARPEARDLNLYGRASLFHLLGTVASPPGRASLAGWLDAPAPPEEIRRRQEAMRELSRRPELCQELQTVARQMANLAHAEPFLDWAEKAPWLLDRPGLLWLSRGMAALSVGLLAATIFGLVPWSVWAAVAVINLVIDYRASENVQGILDRVEAREVGFRHYARLFEIVHRSGPWESELLTELSRAMIDDEDGEVLPAHQAMDRLASRVVLGDARHSALVHAPLEALLLWDFHVLYLIERWQRAHGPHVRRWLDALGAFEALAALGTLAFENPSWSDAEVEASAPGEPVGTAMLRAEALGHPLLPPDARVDNDVELGPPGTFLLVTGSNMSGKSTLLRALGTNVTLAQAGGPVCARRLRLPPVVLGTSLLVEDSLVSGVSFFMAELQRLKAIVDRADRLAENRSPGAPVLLFLLDEVLRGTNSAERRIAIEKVLSHLMQAGAIGAVTTHDLALADSESLAAAARPVHFRETLHARRKGDTGPAMTFDFQLRPGLATTTNALALLRMVGLDEEEG